MTATIYVGTYTKSRPDEEHRPEGIFIYSMDPATGRLERVRGVASGENPSFLALHPAGKHLYAANETFDSAASAFAIDDPSGELRLLNWEATGGMHACYASVDPSGGWLLVSNYSSGSLSVFPIRPDGSLGPRSDLVQHQGRGPNQKRQEGPHAHSIRFDPSGRYVLAADLGIDRVMVYRLDGEKGKLTPNDPPWLEANPGAGPRHIAFHANGRVLYVANELDSTVAVYSWDAELGAGRLMASVSTLPEGFDSENIVADIHLTPSGAFLYVSNRGDNSLAGYRVAADGSLEPVGIYPCGGNWPRNFAIDPAGKFLVVANQYSNSLVVYKIEPDGALTPTGQAYDVPAPVCVLFK